MISNRRGFFGRAFSSSAFAWALPRTDGETSPFVPVVTPDVDKLPFRMVDGVKEFHLTAEVVRTFFVPGRVVDAWGFNNSVPGPTIEVQQGDRIRIIFENQLPELTAIHWHGIEAPMAMEGSVGLGMDPVAPGGKYTYEFTLNQHGTFFYHSHFAMQEMMGMIGLMIIHPRQPYQPKVDRDFGLIVQEWMIQPNNTVPNALAMEFNWLTFNGRSGPDCMPMLVKQGERVRIRMVNLGMDHHPMHMHGHQFTVTGTEAGRKPSQTWFEENTVLLGVAQARDIEFEAKHLGDWMLHCHLPHHMMNQMVTMVGPQHMDMRQAGVPGYPQDMWMPADELYEKAETYGLRSGWSAAMMGMMTLVRVLTAAQFDEIERLKKEPRKIKVVPQAAHQHEHGEVKK